MSVTAMSGWLDATILVPLLFWACATDIRWRRIPNTAVAVIALAGIAVSLLAPGTALSLPTSLTGIATGLAVWLPFYAFGLLGAGDVKLFAAAAAWLGPRGAVEGALLAALAGGVLGLAFMLESEGVGMTVLRLGAALRVPGVLRGQERSRTTRVPYALAITAGVLGAAYFPGVL